MTRKTNDARTSAPDRDSYAATFWTRQIPRGRCVKTAPAFVKFHDTGSPRIRQVPLRDVQPPSTPKTSDSPSSHDDLSVPRRIAKFGYRRNHVQLLP
ncbi:hypothetical protein CFC21_097804 [Triticum aestivum]|uniref:Uncharacterized protein n=2 Tax=Triticum aestivum TaxID=4565 RepID=A0A9R1LVC6_WHEAT|nr:hypothetical protein CFC21_097804 [Triticum aestivum]